MTDPLILARALAREQTSDAEDALIAAIRRGRLYELPDGTRGDSLPGALADWLDAAARGGRPRTRTADHRKVQVVLTPEAAEVWDRWPAGTRSARVSALIEREE